MSEDKKIIDIAKQVIDDEVEALIGLKDYICLLYTSDAADE